MISFLSDAHKVEEKLLMASNLLSSYQSFIQIKPSHWVMTLTHLEMKTQTDRSISFFEVRPPSMNAAVTYFGVNRVDVLSHN